MTSFRLFPDLPLELQTQIWETCTAGPCMHIFDVCFPSRRPERAGWRVDVKTQQRLGQTVFLDRLGPEVRDPSMYRYATTLRRTSRAAAWTQAARSGATTTTVCLPGRGGARVAVPAGDVLMLRFRDGPGPDPEAAQSCIGPVLRCQWSAELAAALCGARKVALDVVEGRVFSPHDTLGWDEITHLASTLHRDLEVLYLVDNCAGRRGIGAGRLQAKGTLWNRLDGDGQRPGDVVRAVGTRYTEVFDLEALGWHECHPTYGFAFLMNSAIRLHQTQGGQSVFQGIRVLVAEDEGVAV